MSARRHGRGPEVLIAGAAAEQDHKQAVGWMSGSDKSRDDEDVDRYYY